MMIWIFRIWKKKGSSWFYRIFGQNGLHDRFMSFLQQIIISRLQLALQLLVSICYLQFLLLLLLPFNQYLLTYSQKLPVQPMEQKKQYQNIETNFKQQIPQMNSLDLIFPDIEGQLCSKHSTLLNKLKNKFSSLYDNYQLQRFVILNKIVSLTSNRQLLGFDVKMATQNGIIVAFAKTAKNEPLYINGTPFKQQLVYKFNGQLKQGRSKFQKQISTIIDLANFDLSLSKLNGGLIYVHHSISQNSQNFMQLLLLGIFIAILCINEQQKILTKEEIIKKLSQSQIFNKTEDKVKFLKEQFLNYQKRTLKIVYGNNLQQLQTQNLPLNKKNKCIVYDFGFDLLQKQFTLSRVDYFLRSKKYIKKQQKQIKNQNEYFKNQNPNSLTYKYQQILQLFRTEIISLEEFIGRLSQIQEYELNLYSVELMQKVNHLKKIMGLNENKCVIVDSQYLLIPVSSSSCLQKLRNIRKTVSVQIQNPQALQKRFGNSPNINEILFTAAGAKAISILNPINQIWFK